MSRIVEFADAGRRLIELAFASHASDIKCLDCGHVGCCDQSIGKHATKHAEATGHNCIRSFEPGEEWRYCYADGSLA